jgi:hypothetical protein
MSPKGDAPTIAPDREVERDRDTIGTTHPLPAVRLVAPQRRQMVL